MKSVTKEFGRDSIIYREGELPEVAFRIIRGNVELSVSQAGRKVVIGTLGPEDTFGEMSLMQRRPREITVRALNDVDVRILDEASFVEYLTSNKDALVKYLNAVYERARATSDRLRAEMARNYEEDRLPTNISPSEVELTPVDAHDATEPTPASPKPAPVPEASKTEFREDQPLRIWIHPDSEATLRQSLLQSREIESFPFRIGRRLEMAGIETNGASNDMNIADVQPYRISRHHCAIEIYDGACFVRDCESQLGTIVNGLMIGDSARTMQARLKPGINEIILGDQDSPYRFKVELRENKQTA